MPIQPSVMYFASTWGATLLLSNCPPYLHLAISEM